MIRKYYERLYSVLDCFVDNIKMHFSIEYEQTCILPDWLFLKLMYKKKMGRPLHLLFPKRYSEKLQWLKLHNRNPLFSRLVDKYQMKIEAERILGDKHIIPTYGVWNSFQEINFDTLPNSFVLKSTHDSGGIYIVKDKSALDYADADKFFSWRLKRSHYKHGREWPYKNVTPRILAEKYMVDESGYELKDYKVFLFNGKARVIQVDFGRFNKHKRNLYTTTWEKLPYSVKYESDNSVIIPRPTYLDEMINIAEIIGKNIPHVRVDFYVVPDNYYLGEITFYHESGFGKFSDEKMDSVWGSWINLHIKEKE